VVLNQTSLSPEEELVNDITSIIHVFSSRLHGLRRYSVKVEEDKSVSNDGTEREIEEDVWDVEVHV